MESSKILESLLLAGTQKYADLNFVQGSSQKIFEGGKLKFFMERKNLGGFRIFFLKTPAN